MQFDESHINPLVQLHEVEQQSPKLLDDGHLEEEYLSFVTKFKRSVYVQVPVVPEP